MEYNRPTSFSQNVMFSKCPRSWYMKYVQNIPGIEDLTYAHRGNVVHHCLENYYPEKTKSVEEIKQMFEQEWKKFKLDETILRKKKDETWLMILNGINLNLDVTSTELKIYYPDVVAFIDVVDSKNKKIYDWKSSTISEENKSEYMAQVKYYAWLYYRKFNELLDYSGVFYLKYSGTNSEMGCQPTMEDIQNAESWHNKIRDRMNYFINNPKKLPSFNKDFFFCPYKHLWDLENKDNLFKIILKISGNYIYLKGDIDEFLEKHIDKKFSYEPKNSYFIKKNSKNPNIDTTVRLYNKKYKRITIGFLNQLTKTLYDYAEFKLKIPVIEIVDTRVFDSTKINMPDKLLSGKSLRPYQEESIDKFLNSKGYKIGILEITTGAGKSLMATEIIRRLGLRTLFVIDKKELMYQTKEVFEEELGIEVGLIGDGHKNIKDITIATIQTLIKNKDEYEEYLFNIPVVIIDESHKISSKSYYTLGHMLKNNLYRLGLTGTSFRDDGNDMMITATCGDIIHSITGQILIEKGYLMKPDIYFIDYNIPNNFIESMEETLLEQERTRREKFDIQKEQKTIEMDSVDIDETDLTYLNYYTEFIVKNEHRNKCVKRIISDNQDKTILILVKHIEHGESLEKNIPGSKHLYGETNKKKRLEYLEQFKSGDLKVLISTLSIFAEGVNIPMLDIVINAAANKGDVKTIQVLGRVLRKNEGKETATYYDFNDTYKFFYNATSARRNAFFNQGHTVNKLSIILNDEEKNEKYIY